MIFISTHIENSVYKKRVFGIWVSIGKIKLKLYLSLGWTKIGKSRIFNFLQQYDCIFSTFMPFKNGMISMEIDKYRCMCAVCSAQVLSHKLDRKDNDQVDLFQCHIWMTENKKTDFNPVRKLKKHFKMRSTINANYKRQNFSSKSIQFCCLWTLNPRNDPNFRAWPNFQLFSPSRSEIFPVCPKLDNRIGPIRSWPS